MDENELLELSGTVDSVIYKNEENGYTVLRLRDENGEGVTVVGCFPYAAPGESMIVSGNWVSHSVHGKQFKAEFSQRMLPSTAPAIYEYLAGGAVRGIGPATAAGIRAFAFDLHGVYLETNVRTVLLHELLPGREDVPDRELAELAEATCPPDGGFADDPADDPRSWYYAMLDYGAYLKRTVANPSRRSRAHAKQSRFEGSRRQKRAALVRALLARREGASMGELVAAVRAEGIELDDALAAELMSELAAEGFCRASDGLWLP